MHKGSKAAEQNVTELYKENIKLRQNQSGFSGDDIDVEECRNKRQYFIARLKKTLKLICPIVVVVIVFVTCITMLLMYYIGVTGGWQLGGKEQNINLKQSATTGQRIDKDLQDCEAGNLKKTFPDVDYAFYGYNIFRGYPLAVGHDPGLTHPIFEYDYSEKKQSADCRFAIPKGLILAPDVSCVTSFTSKVIRDTRQISKELSVSAQVSGGGFGVSFSASTEYKKKSSEMSSRESIFIYSQAKCDYYYAMLDEISPPKLTKSFLKFAKQITTTNDVFKLFDYFGTHFLAHVTFGAKFVYEYKMSKQKLQTAGSSLFSLSAQASYSGMFSFSGGVGMSSSQQQAAENFQSQVETSTISIGAPPPANGDTMTWASTVKDSPVPTRYKLLPIADLFTARYMENTGVDYKAVSLLIKKAKTEYCGELLKKGQIDSCKQLESFTQFKGLSLGLSYYLSMAANFDSCINACLEDSRCIAVNFQSDSGKCYLFNSEKRHTASKNDKSYTVLFIENMKLLDVNMTIHNAAMKAAVTERDGGGEVNNEDECAWRCMRISQTCIAYTVSELHSTKKFCKLYREAVITDETMEVNAKSVLNIVTKFP